MVICGVISVCGNRKTNKSSDIFSRDLSQGAALHAHMSRVEMDHREGAHVIWQALGLLACVPQLDSPMDELTGDDKELNSAHVAWSSLLKGFGLDFPIHMEPRREETHWSQLIVSSHGHGQGAALGVSGSGSSIGGVSGSESSIGGVSGSGSNAA